MPQKVPSTDTAPWEPLEVFQIQLGADAMKDTAFQKWNAAKKYAQAYNRSREKSIAYYNAIKNTPDLITIAIGVFYEKKKHRGVDLVVEKKDGTSSVWKGSDVDYVWLFRFLYEGVDGKNYDPLSAIRDSHRSVESEMRIAARHMLSMAGNGHSITKEKMRDALRPVAETYRDKVLNYIDAGEAPSLSDDTTDFYRPAKKINQNTPLLATGQLRDAIRYEIYLSQSKEFADQVRLISEDLKRMDFVGRAREGRGTRIAATRDMDGSELKKLLDIDKYKRRYNAFVVKIHKLAAKAEILKRVHGSESRFWPIENKDVKEFRALQNEAAGFELEYRMAAGFLMRHGVPIKMGEIVK